LSKTETKIKCGRCGTEYLESENNDTACKFHPGPPIFYEGYKGWKCCDRKTIDFDEFMAFETCAIGKHTPKEDKPKPVPTEPQIPPAIVNSSGVETYKNPNEKKEIIPNIKPLAAPVPEEPAVVLPKEIPDPPDAVISVGVRCLHKGCNKSFVNDESRKEECIYHPGYPIFHEGGKGYGCCKKMTLLFEEFLSMEGCTVGAHKFIADPKPAATVNVRHDFYQMGSNVILSFYSKNCDKSASHITFTPTGINVELKLSDEQIFKKNIEFTGGKTIDPATSSYSVLSSKVEVKLRKAAPVDWVKL